MLAQSISKGTLNISFTKLYPKMNKGSRSDLIQNLICFVSWYAADKISIKIMQLRLEHDYIFHMGRTNNMDFWF